MSRAAPLPKEPEPAASPLQVSLRAVLKPLTFAARDEFSHLDRVQDLEAFVARACRGVLDMGIPAGLRDVLVKVEERDIDVRLRFTELYVEKDGTWKMALWHSTRVP